MELKQGYKQTEVGVIPSDWEVKVLGEIGTFKNGINKSNEDFGFGYPFVNLMDVFGKSSISRNENFGLINSNEIERKLYDLKNGDVLFIRSSVKPSGVGLTCVIENNLPNIVFSGFIIRYRDNNYLNEGYKRHCFYDERSRNNLIGSSTVSANTNINQEALKKLKISIPPTQEEQIAIATALSNIDELISQTEKLIDKKKDIKQGVVQELLKPKEGWVTKKLGDLVSVIKSGGTPLTSNNEFYKGEIPFLSISDMTKQGKYLTYTSSKISQLGLDNSSSWLVPEDSLIYSMYASVGFVSISKLDIAISQAVLGMQFKNFINIDFMYYTLLSIQKSVLKFVGEGTQKNLNAASVKKFKITYPSISVQKEIAEKLNDLDRDIALSENKLQKLKLQKQGMMQALLTGKIRLL